MYPEQDPQYQPTPTPQPASAPPPAPPPEPPPQPAPQPQPQSVPVPPMQTPQPTTMAPSPSTTPPPTLPVEPTEATDYLNQISLEEKPSRPSLFQMDKRFLLIGGLVILIIIVAIIALASNSGSSVPNAEVLGARMNGLSTLIKYGQSNAITDAKVNRMVAEFSLLQSGEKYQLSTVFGNNGSFAKPSTAVQAKESTDETTKKLDEAKKLGSINAMYKEALIAKVESVISLLKTTLSDIATQAQQKIIQNAIDNYQLILNRFTG